MEVESADKSCLIIDRWTLGNKIFVYGSHIIRYLHIDYNKTEEKYKEETAKGRFTSEIKSEIRRTLCTLPENIRNLKNLEILHINSRYPYNESDVIKLQVLPDYIGELNNLTTLDLPLNSLTELPDSIGNLKKLRKLNLEENDIQSLPESLVKLKKLETLNLKSNKKLYGSVSYGVSLFTKEIPEKIYDFLDDLKELNLPEHMSIRQFDHGILQKTVTTKTDKYHCENGRKVYDSVKIVKKPCGIPLDISVNNGMEKLDARNVSVKKIPRSLSKLTQLKTLDLRENPNLTMLPNCL